MRRFLAIIHQLYDLQADVAKKMDKVFLSFALARTGNSLQELEELLPEGSLTLEVKEEKVFNLTIPRITMKEMKKLDYDFLRTEAELDIGMKKMRALVEDLTEMARLWKAVELLTGEIEATRRRVNALEHILIPNIKETIRYISARLDEMERSYQVQLMRVKEIVRSH